MKFASSGLAFRQPVEPLLMVRESSPTYGSSDDDALTSLGEEIMTLSEQLHAATHRLLLLIAEFDRRQGWKLHGFTSCADWLAWSTRLDKVTARERVRVARALAGLPETSAAMARGELSFSQVRAITRVANDENELDLLEHARSTSASGLEKLVRSWRRLDREDEAEQEQRRLESRCLSVFADDQGMYLVRGKLDPEAAAMLMRAIEAASDALYKGSVPETTPEQRRADALALLAERTLAVGLGRDDSAEASDDSDTERDSAEAPEATAADRPRSRTGCRADRYLVVLHVDPATLDPNQQPGRSELQDGTRVSAESSRRICCDTNLVRVAEGQGGAVQAEGKTRTVPPRMRRALEVRDRGCRFPGCGSRFTDTHHIHHWIDGGPTRLDNLVLLCKAHHRLLHEGGFRLEANPRCPGKPIFFSPRGVRIPEVPPRMTVGGRPLGGGDSSGGKAPEALQWEEDVPLGLYLRALESLT